MDDIERLDDDTDLVYSRDDGGWYIQQEYESAGLGYCERTSIVYRDKSVAIKAYHNNSIEWD